jgi:hypothetical protein
VRLGQTHDDWCGHRSTDDLRRAPRPTVARPRPHIGRSQVTAKRTIIVDTDPGQDDAIALLFALAAGNRLAHQGMCPKAMAAAS